MRAEKYCTMASPIMRVLSHLICLGTLRIASLEPLYKVCNLQYNYTLCYEDSVSNWHLCKAACSMNGSYSFLKCV